MSSGSLSTGPSTPSNIGSPKISYPPPPPKTLADYFTDLDLADLTQNLSIAPPPIMTTLSPKELRINTPSTFDGTSSKAQRWLDSVWMYIYFNRELYDTDEKQVIFALSFITENSARVWSSTYIQTSLGHNPVNFGTFLTFTTEFKALFIHEDTKSNAITWLTTTKVTEELPLNKYISLFQNKVATSKITDQGVLINYFAVGINPSLMCWIMSMDTVPTTIEEWYNKAIHFKTQWERADVLDNRKGLSTLQPKNLHSSLPNTDP